MKKTALVIMAAGIGKPFWKRNQAACTGRTEVVRLLWIIPSMMHWRQDSTRLYLLSVKILRMSSKE